MDFVCVSTYMEPTKNGCHMWFMSVVNGLKVVYRWRHQNL